MLEVSFSNVKYETLYKLLAYYVIVFLSIYILLSLFLFTFYTNNPIGYFILKNFRLFFVVGFIFLYIFYKIWKKKDFNKNK